MRVVLFNVFYFVFGLAELEVQRLVEKLELNLDLQKITYPFRIRALLRCAMSSTHLYTLLVQDAACKLAVSRMRQPRRSVQSLTLIQLASER